MFWLIVDNLMRRAEKYGIPKTDNPTKEHMEFTKIL